MYSAIKRIILFTSFLLISLGGVLLAHSYRNEYLGDYPEILSVEKSTVDFSQVIEDYAQNHHLVFARRIVDSFEDETGAVKNTFVPIGAAGLPSNLKMQTNPDLIESSSYNTIYLIVSGELSSDQVADDLSSMGNIVYPYHIQYGSVLLKYVIGVPQFAFVGLGILTAYTALVLAENISEMKETGIRRLSGEGKYQIAVKQLGKDSLFIAALMIFAFAFTGVMLCFFQLLSSAVFIMIAVPVLIWGMILLALNFLLSQSFYHILQGQPIALSVKGKAPVKSLFSAVTATQMIVLITSMYCAYGIDEINQRIDQLNDGIQEWIKFSDYYQITHLDDGGTISGEQREHFFEELKKDCTLIYRKDEIDNASFFEDRRLMDIYDPDPYGNGRVIFGNDNFILKSGIILPAEAKSFLTAMKKTDKIILIPESQKENYERLSQEWTAYCEGWYFSQDQSNHADSNPEAEIKTFLYKGGKVFTYPLYSKSGGARLFSDLSYLEDPIIIGQNPDFQSDECVQNLILDQPQRAASLIRSQRLTAEFGSLTNGLSLIQSRLQDRVLKRNLVLIAVGLSFCSSLVLFVLMNAVYFFQGRKTHFIERLSGMSFLAIHKKYLAVICSGYFAAALVSLILGWPLLVALVPIGFLSILLGIFWIQLYRDQKANVLYIKGE